MIILFLNVEFLEHVFPLKKKVPNMASDSAPKILNLIASSSDVRVIATEPRRSKRYRIETNFRPNFIATFLVKALENLDVHVIIEEFVSIFLIEEDPITYQEAIRSIDATF